jgi:hypothetical protein
MVQLRRVTHLLINDEAKTLGREKVVAYSGIALGNDIEQTANTYSKYGSNKVLIKIFRAKLKQFRLALL